MSTRTTRASIRKRPSRGIPAVIVALVLLAVAVTAVWSGITVLTGGNTAIVDGISSAKPTHHGRRKRRTSPRSPSPSSASP